MFEKKQKYDREITYPCVEMYDIQIYMHDHQLQPTKEKSSLHIVKSVIASTDVDIFFLPNFCQFQLIKVILTNETISWLVDLPLNSLLNFQHVTGPEEVNWPRLNSNTNIGTPTMNNMIA